MSDVMKNKAEKRTPSQWSEFLSEFKLGLRVFLGFEEETVRTNR